MKLGGSVYHAHWHLNSHGTDLPSKPPSQGIGWPHWLYVNHTVHGSPRLGNTMLKIVKMTWHLIHPIPKPPKLRCIYIYTYIIYIYIYMWPKPWLISYYRGVKLPCLLGHRWNMLESLRLNQGRRAWAGWGKKSLRNLARCLHLLARSCRLRCRLCAVATTNPKRSVAEAGENHHGSKVGGFLHLNGFCDTPSFGILNLKHTHTHNSQRCTRPRKNASHRNTCKSGFVLSLGNCWY